MQTFPRSQCWFGPCTHSSLLVYIHSILKIIQYPWLFKSQKYPLVQEETCTHLPEGAGVLQWWSCCLPPVWPRFKSQTQCHKWVEFVVGSCPCCKGFSPGCPVFLPPQKSTSLNFNLIWAMGFSVIRLLYVLPSLNKVDLFIYHREGETFEKRDLFCHACSNDTFPSRRLPHDPTEVCTPR